MAQKNKYTLEDLDWLEETLKQLKAYVDNNNFGDLKDRLETVMSAKGTPVIKIIATKEAQMKSLREALKDYVVMLAEVDRLREEQTKKDVEIRGGGKINGMMAAKLNPQASPDQRVIEDDRDNNEAPVSYYRGSNERTHNTPPGFL
jgi:hypothetical protein